MFKLDKQAIKKIMEVHALEYDDRPYLQTLREQIEDVIDIIASREKIFDPNEGLLSIEYIYLSEGITYSVKIKSRYLDQLNLPSQWEGKTLNKALQKALNTVQSWYNLEKDLTEEDPWLLKGLAKEYINE